ncbi:MAG TPA: glycosyltransferase family 2 protein [Pirellulales bacterium]|nr:glycosyltransferase family 2 protein [Pirellulales bacterium]
MNESDALSNFGSRPATERKLVSIIMPVRNEEGNLPRAYDEVTALMAPLPYDYEVLLIDNDSSDRTGELAAELCNRDARWRYIKFSRNFTVEASLAAGYRFARGDAAVVLFGDLQDPPALVAEFLRKWEEGNEVVYGVIRRRDGDPLWKAWAARLLYRTVNYLSDVKIPNDATDFRLLSRRAIDALNRLGERNRYIRGFSHWIGFRQCPIVYDRRPRLAGKSKAPFFYMLNLAANAITCFSIKPLQLFSLFGFLTLGATIVAGLVYLATYCFGATVPGLTTVYLLLLANLGVMLVGFGTVGEYVGRIYVETKQRPLFLVERTVNFPAAEQESGVGLQQQPVHAERRAA